MLPPAIQQQILDLLNSGLSSAETRRRTGASRNAIRRLSRQRFSPRKAIHDKLGSFDGFDESQPVSRCPVCGALTCQPCWRCALLKRLDELQNKSSEGLRFESLDELQNKSSEGLRFESLDELQNKPFEGLRFESLDELQNKSSDDSQNETFIDPFGNLTAADSLFGLSLEAVSLRSASVEYCELALKPEHRKRYEQVRRSRLNREK